MKKFSILPALAFAACSDSEEISSVATTPNVTSSLASLEKSGARFYDVTIENLTTGQPLSPNNQISPLQAATVFVLRLRENSRFALHR